MKCRHAKAHCEGQLPLHSPSDDHTGTLNWDTVLNMLQSKQSGAADTADDDILAEAQHQVRCAWQSFAGLEFLLHKHKPEHSQHFKPFVSAVH